MGTAKKVFIYSLGRCSIVSRFICLFIFTDINVIQRIQRRVLIGRSAREIFRSVQKESGRTGGRDQPRMSATLPIGHVPAILSSIRIQNSLCKTDKLLETQLKQNTKKKNNNNKDCMHRVASIGYQHMYF